MADCRVCEHFAEFKEPFHYDALGYEDGVTVYGVCFKRCSNHTCFPVYIPDSGSACNDFKKKPGAKVINADPEQLEISNLLEEI